MQLKVSMSKEKRKRSWRRQDHLLKVRASRKLQKKGTCPSASVGILTQWFSTLAAPLESPGEYLTVPGVMM